MRAGELQISFFDRERKARRRYTPAFVVQYERRTTVCTAVVDVLPSSELWGARRSMRANFTAARQWIADQTEMSFAVVTDKALRRGAWLANARLLSPYLDRPIGLDMISAVKRAVESGEAQVRNVLEMGRQQGLNQQELLAAIYRMAATGELQLDLGFPITGGTWVRCVGPQD